MKEGFVRKIIVMGGSFNPPTLAHQKLLLGAVDYLGAEKGIFVPSSNKYVRRKMCKSEYGSEIFSESVRLEMLKAMAEDDPRLDVDDLEYHRTEGKTFETLEAIQKKYQDATIYFLAGGDKVSIISKWHRKSELLEQFKILVVKRGNDDPEKEIENNSFLKQYSRSFIIMSAPDGIDEISSSLVRKKLRDNEKEVENMLHHGVWQIICKNGGYK